MRLSIQLIDAIEWVYVLNDRSHLPAAALTDRILQPAFVNRLRGEALRKHFNGLIHARPSPRPDLALADVGSDAPRRVKRFAVDRLPSHLRAPASSGGSAGEPGRPWLFRTGLHAVDHRSMLPPPAYPG